MVGFHTGRLDREVALAPGAECGLALKRVGEWAVIVGTPPAWGGGKARVGDVLAAVDGASALLGGYEAMFRPVWNPNQFRDTVQRERSGTNLWELSLRASPGDLRGAFEPAGPYEIAGNEFDLTAERDF